MCVPVVDKGSLVLQSPVDVYKSNSVLQSPVDVPVVDKSNSVLQKLVAVPVVCRKKRFSEMLFTLVLKVKAENLSFLLCIISICHYFFCTPAHH